MRPAKILYELLNNYPLSFFKSSAKSFSTILRAASFDIHMLCETFIVTVIHTFRRLAVDTDGLTWMF